MSSNKEQIKTLSESKFCEINLSNSNIGFSGSTSEYSNPSLKSFSSDGSYKITLSEGSESSIGDIDPLNFKKKGNVKKVLGFIWRFLKSLWSIRVLSVINPILFILITGIVAYIVGRIFANFLVDRQLERVRLLLMDDVKSEINTIFTPFTSILCTASSQLHMLSDFDMGISDFNQSFPNIVSALFSISTAAPGDFRIGIGWEDGHFMAHQRVNDVYYVLTLNEKKFMVHLDMNNETGAISNPKPLIPMPYNPVITPWYAAGLKVSYQQQKIDRNRVGWGSIFFAGIEGQIALNAGIPIYDKNGTLISVVTSLLYLNSILSRNVDFNENYVIIDDSGVFIGTSMKVIEHYNQTLADIGGRASYYAFYYLHDHSSSLMRQIGALLLNYFGSYEDIDEIEMYMPYLDDILLIEVGVWENADGLKMYVILIFSQKELYQYIYYSQNYTLLAVLCCIVIAVIFTTLFSLVITYPITTIANQISKISELKVKKRKIGIGNNVLKLHELNLVSGSVNKLEKVFENFEKFIPKDLMSFFREKKIHRTLWRQEITIMFIDICSFTSLAEKMDEKSLVEYLTTFFVIVEYYVSRYSGIIDKFIGDCCMALFSAPVKLENHELCAVKCVLSILKGIRSSNKKNFVIGKRKLRVRCGINTDMCLVGFCGTHSRYSYTAFGDGVNSASRLEVLNKKYHTKVLIGEKTNDAVKGVIKTKFVDKVKLRGKDKGMNVFSVLGRIKGSFTPASPMNVSTRIDVKVV